MKLSFLSLKIALICTFILQNSYSMQTQTNFEQAQRALHISLLACSTLPEDQQVTDEKRIQMIDQCEDLKGKIDAFKQALQCLRHLSPVQRKQHEQDIALIEQHEPKVLPVLSPQHRNQAPRPSAAAVLLLRRNAHSVGNLTQLGTAQPVALRAAASAPTFPIRERDSGEESDFRHLRAQKLTGRLYDDLPCTLSKTARHFDED